MQAIITDLVFEHALRIRVKAGTADDDDGDVSEGFASRDESVVETADLLDEAPADTDRTSNTPAKGKGKSVRTAEPTADAAKADRAQGNAGSAHLIGRINNLVSGDLRTLDDLSQYAVFFSRYSFCAHSCQTLTRTSRTQRWSGRSK